MRTNRARLIRSSRNHYHKFPFLSTFVRRILEAGWALAGLRPARRARSLSAAYARMNGHREQPQGVEYSRLSRPIGSHDDRGSIHLRFALCPARGALRRRERPRLELAIEESFGIDRPR